MSNPPCDEDWYKNFFSGAALDLWRQAKSDDETKSECEFLEEIFDSTADLHLLDVPCGNGRLTLPMAEAGFRVTGVDFCTEFLDEARKLALAADCADELVQFVPGDMRTISIREKFDGAFCFGNSFGYFDRAGTAEMFQALSNSVRAGGKVVIDSSMLAETFLVNGAEREWLRVGDMLMLIENHYDVRESCVRTDYTFIRDGKQESRQATHWIYTSGEVCSMLSKAGFKVRDLFGSLQFDAFELGSERMLLVAEKT
ncbi:MAG TPA: class I SAM-dependent methyltransferase [Drouetiella sp.]